MRDGKRVRTRSEYLGAGGGGILHRRGVVGALVDFLAAQRVSPEDRAMASIQKEAERVEKAQAAYESDGYKNALKALGDGAVRDVRIVAGLE